MGYLRTLCAKAASRRLTQEGISYNQPGLLQWTVSLAFGITLLRVTVIPSLTMVWAATPLIFFSVWEVVLPGQQTFLFSRSYVALHKKFKKFWGVSP